MASELIEKLLFLHEFRFFFLYQYKRNRDPKAKEDKKTHLLILIRKYLFKIFKVGCAVLIGKR